MTTDAHHVPPGLQTLLMIVVGNKWPTGDEAALRAEAAAWRDASDAIKALIPEVVSVKQSVDKAVSGPLLEEADSFLTGLVGSGDEGDTSAVLPLIVQCCEDSADALDDLANEIETLRVVIIGTLAVLAVQLTIDAVFAAFGGEVAAAAEITAARIIVTALLRNAIIHVLTRVGESILAQVGFTLLAQVIEIGQGHRKTLDGEQLSVSAVNGAIGGAVGYGMGLAGGAIAHAVGKMATKVGIFTKPDLLSKLGQGGAQFVWQSGYGALAGMGEGVAQDTAFGLSGDWLSGGANGFLNGAWGSRHGVMNPGNRWSISSADHLETLLDKPTKKLTTVSGGEISNDRPLPPPATSPQAVMEQEGIGAPSTAHSPSPPADPSPPAPHVETAAAPAISHAGSPAASGETTSTPSHPLTVAASEDSLPTRGLSLAGEAHSPAPHLEVSIAPSASGAQSFLDLRPDTPTSQGLPADNPDPLPTHSPSPPADPSPPAPHVETAAAPAISHAGSPAASGETTSTPQIQSEPAGNHDGPLTPAIPHNTSGTPPIAAAPPTGQQSFLDLSPDTPLPESAPTAPHAPPTPAPDPHGISSPDVLAPTLHLESSAPLGSDTAGGAAEPVLTPAQVQPAPAPPAVRASPAPVGEKNVDSTGRPNIRGVQNHAGTPVPLSPATPVGTEADVPQSAQPASKPQPAEPHGPSSTADEIFEILTMNSSIDPTPDIS